MKKTPTPIIPAVAAGCRANTVFDATLSTILYA
jgi:hypothetical protein